MREIKEVQQILQQKKIDGWLLYDFHRINLLALEFLEIPEDEMLTRRLFYWIPSHGEPVTIVHGVETHVANHLPGKKLVYASWKKLEEHLKSILTGKKSVAMEYSPQCDIPTASRVDGGTLDLVRKFGVDVVSSAGFFPYLTCVWTPEQYRLHKEAADLLDRTAAMTWELIGTHLQQNKAITEYDVQQFILGEMEKAGCVTEGKPICGVNENSANPHYEPTAKSCKRIQEGDFIQIDLWCKRKVPHAVFADISRVAVAGTPSQRHQEIFQIVRAAQKAGSDLVKQKIENGEELKGCEVDDCCRQVVEKAGYGDYFTHRTGHNIHEENHGPGPNIDNFETKDQRVLIPKTCFSIEPGIYLPKEFGVRLEYDVYIHEDRKVEITGGIEESLVAF